MHKYTQRELIQEGFWQGFKNAAKGAATFGKEVAKVVAPEITDPLSKAINWKDKTVEKTRAASNPVEAVKNFLIDNGYFPYEKIVAHQKGKLEGSGKSKGGQNYITKVKELQYDKDGKAELSQYDYSNPVTIVSMDKDYNMSFLKRPRRDYAKVRTGKNTTTPAVTPAATAPTKVP
jgi:hypothetical protein